MIIGGGTPAAPPSGCAAGTIAIGDNTAGASKAIGADNVYLYFAGYTAAESCSIDRLRVWIDDHNVSRNIRMGIYANGTNAPTGSPLATSDPVATPGAGGDPISIDCTITPVAVTASTKYWLALWVHETDINVYDNGDVLNSTGYMEATYSATGAMPTISGFSGWDKQFVGCGKMAD